MDLKTNDTTENIFENSMHPLASFLNGLNIRLVIMDGCGLIYPKDKLDKDNLSKTCIQLILSCLSFGIGVGLNMDKEILISFFKTDAILEYISLFKSPIRTIDDFKSVCSNIIGICSNNIKKGQILYITNNSKLVSTLRDSGYMVYFHDDFENGLHM